MPVDRLPKMMADDYFAWALGRPGRYELDAGLVVTMRPETRGHSRIKLHAMVALHEAVVKAGLRCEVVGDGASIRVDDHTVFEPDTCVTFAGVDDPDDSLVVTDPIIIVEVLSPSSRGVDTRRKLEAYFRVPSVIHCLVIDSQPDVVVHHQRVAEDEVRTKIIRQGTIALEPPGIELAFDDLFRHPASA